MSRISRVDNPGLLVVPASAARLGWVVVNSLTLLVAVVGLVGGYLASLAEPRLLLYWLLVAALLDAVDGPLARSWGVVSRFGQRADRVADLVAFVLVPGLVAWQSGLIAGWLAGLLVISGVVRAVLLREGALLASGGERYFGLPFPLAGLLLAAGLVGPQAAVIGLVVVVGLVTPLAVRRPADLGLAGWVMIGVGPGIALWLATADPLHVFVVVGAGLYVITGVSLRRNHV
ncbi:CDP-alcohol phosphatidyltransferase family protein [Mucisphaera sp.]|uniref:CDP-alcohol phosphatidyltransferase family protein n=1 Tax=Mucisphaera sp. TaxID=2913024 RepID=UPI003D105445